MEDWMQSIPQIIYKLETLPVKLPVVVCGRGKALLKRNKFDHKK